jgi:hypothetical protein
MTLFETVACAVEGARVYTLLLYLNTPDEGGETCFDDLNITVNPTIGKAVLWPNVMDEDVETTELFAWHQVP